MHVYSDHNDGVTTPRGLVERVEAMKPLMIDWLQKYVASPGNSKRPITHLVMSGISGQSVGWALSTTLKLPGLVVRKPKERAHSGLIVGQGDVRDYVIVDDFISSGASIN